MPESHAPCAENANPQKQRRGWSRLWHATGYSLAGLRLGWGETAFRQELILSAVLVPAAFWLARNWLEWMALVGTLVLVLITELLNTAIESTVDRIGPEWHPLSKRAKDLGSAAVLLALLLCGLAWALAAYSRILN